MDAKKQYILIGVCVVLLLGLTVWGISMTDKDTTQPATADEVVMVPESETVPDETADSDGGEPVSDGAVEGEEKVSQTGSEKVPEETGVPAQEQKVSSKESGTSEDETTDKEETKTSKKSSKKSSKKTSKKPNKSSKKTSDSKSDKGSGGGKGTGNSTESTGESKDNPKQEPTVYTAKLGGVTITSPDASCDVTGKVATIKKAGTYTLSGTAGDGQVVIEAAKTAGITLICHNVNLTNSNSSAIYVKSADKVKIQLAEGTQNTFTDGTKYSLATGVTEPDGAIFSQEDLTITGSGSLQVNARYLDGIVSKNDLNVEGGTVTVTSVDDGFRGKDGIHISGGKVSIVSQAHGMKTTEDGDLTKGMIKVSGGETSIEAEKDGIHATNDVTVSGGTLYVDGKNEGIDTDKKFVITGGTAIVDGPKSTNHASMDCGGGYVLNGGTFFAVGSSSLIQAPASGSKQKFICYKFAVEQPTESKVAIRSSAGKNLVEHTTTRKFQHVIFSAPSLSKGTYGIFSGSTHITDYTVD